MSIDIVIIVCAGLAAFMLVWVVSYLLTIGLGKDRKRMTNRIGRVAGSSNKPTESLVRQETLSNIQWLHGFLSMFNNVQKLKKLILQAGLDISPGAVILASLTISLFSFLLLYRFNLYVALGVAAFGLCLPVLIIKFLKRKRMNRFLNQLPDALDSLARALDSGHALSSGLSMISKDYSAPIGEEFGIMLQEVNYGISMDKALLGLADRVDLQDLRFFVTSLMVQRETGGNLAEIVQTIAYLIRERFKLEGKVRVLTAECRVSAVILLFLPLALAIFIQIFNPEYLGLLYTTETGIFMLKGAFVALLIGLFVIKKMIKVKV